MTNFLPEPAGQHSTGYTLTPNDLANIDQGDETLMLKVIKTMIARPQKVPQEFWGLITDQIQVGNLLLPISQIIGFSQFTAVQATTILTTETTSSASYTDLGTVGPTLTGLPDGDYVLLYGAACKTSSAGDATGANFSISLNGAAPSDDDLGGTSDDNWATATMFAKKTLSSNNQNTVTLQYLCRGGATGSFARRVLLALKVSNT